MVAKARLFPTLQILLSAAALAACFAPAALAAPSAGGTAPDGTYTARPPDAVALELGGDLPDPGSHGRIRHMSGGVEIERAHEDRLDEGIVNAPVFAGDTVRLGNDGAAEVQLADGSLIRLWAGTTAEFRSLVAPYGRKEDTTILRLASGSMYLDVRARESDERDPLLQVDTPAASIYVTSPGLFRVDVLPSQVTRVLAASYRGTAEVVGEDGSVLLRSGQKTDVYAGEAPKRAISFNSYQMDDFDRWNEERATYYARATRDQRESGAYAAHQPAAGQDYEYRDYDENVDYEQIPDEVRPYYGELSSQGRWTFIPEFGPVWYPLGVGTAWRPYYSGRWMYGPYGWNWASYEPWGWAPYHYGRWHWTTGFGWIWAPGSVFSGAWCSWYYGPSYIGWCPLDYYDCPAFINIGFYLGGWGCDPYCWNFVPYGGFHHDHDDGHDHHHGEDIKRIAVPEMKQGVIVKRPVSGRSGYISGGSADRARLLEQARKRANWESTQSREAPPARGAGGSVEKPYRSFRDQERPAIEKIRRGEFRRPDIQAKGGEAVSPGGRYERKTPGTVRTSTQGGTSGDDRGIAGKGTAPQKGTTPQVDRKAPKTFPRKEGSAPPAQRQSYTPKDRQAQARGSDVAGSSRPFAADERLQSRDSRTPERARPQGSPRYGSVQGGTQGSPSSAERSGTPSDERLRRLFRDADRPSSAPQSGGSQPEGPSTARPQRQPQPGYGAQPRRDAQPRTEVRQPRPAQPRPEARAPRSDGQPRREASPQRSGSQPRPQGRPHGRSEGRSGSGSGQQHDQKPKKN